jgi:type VI secretion system ImpC/EvpB family protein
MPGRIEFDMNFGRRPGRRRDDEVPMRLLLLGDFSGAPAAERPPVAERPTHQVDIDTFTKAMQRVRPRVRTAAGDIVLRDLDDFHPDHLAQLDSFKTLHEKRAQPPPEEDDPLARLLGKPAATHPPSPTPAGGIDALIRDIVAPHIVKDTSLQARLHADAVDAELGDRMRELLHDRAFQAIEAAWRGVHWLMTSVELDENLQLHLFDVTRDELLADITAAGGRIGESGLYRALVDRWRRQPGAAGWSALVSLHQFGPSDTDAGLLAALGLIASQAGAPFIAGGELSLVDASEQRAPAWHALRGTEAAPWIALAAPRVLLRLPYGARTDPVQAFAFEEAAAEPEHERFLWGSGALALAVLIARSFTARGWDMELGDEREIDDLPAFTYDRDGQPQLQACAEHYLTERQMNSMLDAGLIPLASRRDRNGVVAIRFQSIARPAAPLVW